MSLLTMGAVYGIVEEGLLLWSFFNPNWEALGGLKGYDSYWGINWIWVIHVTMYHVLYSMGIPLLLSYLIFPENNAQPLLSQKHLKLICSLFALQSLLWFMSVYADYGFVPPILQYSLALLFATSLVIWTRKRAPPRRTISFSSGVNVRRIFLYGVLLQAVQFLITWLGPSTFPLEITMSLYLLWLLVSFSLLKREEMYNANNILAFVQGLIALELLVVLVVDLLSFIVLFPLSLWVLISVHKRINGPGVGVE